MATIAVIGSNCFTGSHIVDALLARTDADILGVSRSPEYDDLFLPYRKRDSARFTFRQIHLTREFDELADLLDSVRPEKVVHVAALSEVGLSNFSPVEYFETNTLGTVKLCHHLQTRGYVDQYIHISSAEIFGSCDRALKETDLFNPSTPYAVSKAAADMYIHTLSTHFGFPATLIRSTNVYGPHQQLFKIIPRTVIYIKKGRILELHGGGAAAKSFVHVRDVVDGLMRAMEQGKTGTFHFSVPSSRTIAETVRIVCEIMGADFDRVTRVVGERLGQDARYWLDCTKAREELGWAPAIDFQSGVSEVLEWIDVHWDRILHAELEYVHRT